MAVSCANKYYRTSNALLKCFLSFSNARCDSEAFVLLTELDHKNKIIPTLFEGA
jgi:hypothetical protein